MSQKERERLKVLHAVQKRHITQEQAGKELGITPRWVRELLRRMKGRGDRAVVHGLRGTLVVVEMHLAKNAKTLSTVPK